MPPETPKPSARDIQVARMLKPDEVPPELRALREADRRKRTDKPTEQPPTPEAMFQTQKAQLLQDLYSYRQIADNRIKKAQNKLKRPDLRTRKDGIFQSDKALQDDLADAEEELLATALQQACLQTSQATTMEEFQREIEKAQVDAAKELGRAYDDHAAPETIQTKRRMLQAVTELERLFTFTFR